MKLTFFIVWSMRVLLQRSTSQRKSLLYMVLAKAATELRQLSAFCPLYPLGTDLDLGTDEVAVEELPVLNQVELANFLAGLWIVHLAALFASLLLESPGLVWSL